MKNLKQILGQTLPNMTLVRKEICEGCGENIEVYKITIPVGPRKGNEVEVKKGCRCEELAFIKKCQEESKKARTAKLQRIFDTHSLVNKKLQAATFENYIPKNYSQEYAKRVAEKYVEIFDLNDPKNLLFTGGYGIGKSHLAKAITDGIIAKGHSAIFTSVPKLLTKFRASYNKDAEHTEEELIEALNTVDLLVLDDLGAEKSSEWAWEKLFEIVDQRQGMHTIYTSNLTVEELYTKLGERNFSRIVNDDTTIVEMEGENYRLRNFGKG